MNGFLWTILSMKDIIFMACWWEKCCRDLGNIKLYTELLNIFRVVLKIVGVVVNQYILWAM